MDTEAALNQLLRGQPRNKPGNYRDLGDSEFVRSLSVRPRNLYGKWCQACEGVWFGTLGEVQCPSCLKRNATKPLR